MIEVEHLVKDYGTVVAVRDVSFTVGRGEVVGVLGPNGAGKSTTLRILTGYLHPTSGRVRIAGHDIASDSLKARAAMGYMPEAAPLYPELRVREYLSFRAQLKGLPRKAQGPAVEQALRRAAVADVAERLIGQLSKGYRQRVALADALLADPPLLILDEPTAGLDPNQIREVRDLIRDLGKAHTILLSTHILSEVESTCDRALVIHQGRLIAEGTLDALRARQTRRSLELVLHDPEDRARAIVEASAGVRKVRLMDAPERAAGVRCFAVEFARKDTDVENVTERLVAGLVAGGVGVREVTPVKATLEQVFARLTRDASGGDPEP